MTSIVRFFGVLGVLVGVIAMLTAGYYAFRLAGGDAWMLFVFGSASLVSGATLYCLGAITDHLSAIEQSNSNQLELMRRADRR